MISRLCKIQWKRVKINWNNGVVREHLYWSAFCQDTGGFSLFHLLAKPSSIDQADNHNEQSCGAWAPPILPELHKLNYKTFACVGMKNGKRSQACCVPMTLHFLKFTIFNYSSLILQGHIKQPTGKRHEIGQNSSLWSIKSTTDCFVTLTTLHNSGTSTQQMGWKGHAPGMMKPQGRGGAVGAPAPKRRKTSQQADAAGREEKTDALC
ncbi:Trehalose-6-phosphate hydrolase [Trichinella pseudospiralis]